MLDMLILCQMTLAAAAVPIARGQMSINNEEGSLSGIATGLPIKIFMSNDKTGHFVFAPIFSFQPAGRTDDANGDDQPFVGQGTASLSVNANLDPSGESYRFSMSYADSSVVTVLRTSFLGSGGAEVTLAGDADAEVTLDRPTRYLVSAGTGVNFGSLGNIEAGTYTGVIKSRSISWGVGAGSTSDASDYGLGPANHGAASASTSLSVTLQGLPDIHFFGVGVDWSKTSNPDRRNVSGQTDVARMYSSFQKFPNWAGGVTAPLDALSPGPANLAIVNSKFTEFASSVRANDTVVLYFSSHGNLDPLTHAPFVETAAESPAGNSYDPNGNLTPALLLGYLDQFPDTVRKIVVLDSCHSGAFGPALDLVKNVAILAAAPPDGNAFVEPDGTGTGVFSDQLESLLNSGEYDLDKIAADISHYNYGDLLGQNLPIKDVGTMRFSGVAPEIYRSGDFSGDFLGPPISLPEPQAFAWLGLAGLMIYFTRRSRARMG